MTSNAAELEDNLDVGKEQRTERLGWVFLGVSVMAMVLGSFFLHERVVAGVSHAWGLTILCYGSVLYVNEIKHIREPWLWKGVVASIPLHLAFISILFWGDVRFPDLTNVGFMFAGSLAIAFVVEMVFVLPIFEHFRSSSASQSVENKEALPLKGRLSRLWRAAASRLRGKLRRNFTGQSGKAMAAITLAGEDAVDFAKEERGSHLNWVFGGIAGLLISVYLFRGVLVGGVWLYILEASLLTAFCYGHLLYVEEKEHIGEPWLWRAVLATIPFHIAILGIIIGIDRAAPALASNTIALIFVLWASGWIETNLMDHITDDFEP